MSAVIHELPAELRAAIRKAGTRHRLEHRTFFVVRELDDYGHKFHVTDSLGLDTFFMGAPVVYCTED